jgi:DNA ligase (NAD+)
MPAVPYKWNETHIDIIVVDMENNETVKEKQIAGFFKGLGVEGLSDGNVVRIIKAGYDTVPKILKMSVVELEKVDGFKNKMAEKIYNGIKDKIETSSIINIMSASNIFGRGFSETKIELIMNEYPEILSSTESTIEKENKVIAIKGMARKSATSFVERIDDFVKFLKECGLEYKLLAGNQNTEKDVNNPL